MRHYGRSRSLQRHSTMKKRASGDVRSSYIDHLSFLVTFKAANYLRLFISKTTLERKRLAASICPTT